MLPRKKPNLFLRMACLGLLCLGGKSAAATGISVEGNQVVVSWEGISNLFYSVRCRTNLIHGAWDRLFDGMVEPGPVSVTNETSGSSGFYRIDSMIEHAWHNESGMLYSTEFSNATSSIINDLGMVFTNQGGGFLADTEVDAPDTNGCYQISNTPSEREWFRFSSPQIFQNHTTYVVHFRARRNPSSQDETQKRISVSLGGYEQLVSIPTNAATRRETFLVDADAAGIAGKPINVEFIAETNTAAGCLNQYRIYDFYLAAMPTLATAGELFHVERAYEDNNGGAPVSVPVDFTNRYTTVGGRNAWTNSQALMSRYTIVAKRYTNYVGAVGSASPLKTDMADIMREHETRVVVNDSILTQSIRLGDPITNFDFGPSIEVVDDMLSNDWDVCEVELQSVLSKFDYSLTPIKDRIEAVVDYAETMKGAFPNLKVGIIDALAVKHLDFLSIYAQLKNALDARGVQLDFIDVDYPVNHATAISQLGSYAEMVYLERYIRHLGFRPGLFLTSSSGGSDSDEAWQDDVLEGLGNLMDEGGRPDSITLAAWFPHPEFTIPDATNGTTQLATFRKVDGLMKTNGGVPGVPLFRDGFEDSGSLSEPWTIPDGRSAPIVEDDAYRGLHSLMLSEKNRVLLDIDTTPTAGNPPFNRIRLTAAVRLQPGYASSEFLTIQWWGWNAGHTGKEWKTIDSYPDALPRFLRYEYILPEAAGENPLKFRFLNWAPVTGKYSLLDEVKVEGLYR